MASRNHLKIEQTEAASLSINTNSPDITQFEAEAEADWEGPDHQSSNGKRLEHNLSVIWDWETPNQPGAAAVEAEAGFCSGKFSSWKLFVQIFCYQIITKPPAARIM